MISMEMKFKDFDQIIEYINTASPITYTVVNLDTASIESLGDKGIVMIQSILRFEKFFGQMKVACTKEF